MKIVHICLAGRYMNGWGYQENLLTKYHKRLGLEVTVITSKYGRDEQGKYQELCSEGTEYDCNGIKIIRLKLKSFRKKVAVPGKLACYLGLYDELCKIQADILFLHNPQTLNLMDLKRYMKEYPETRLYVDNHADYSNSAGGFLSKHILHGIFWRVLLQGISPYTTRFYGVMPSRVDFLVDRYRIPKEEIDLLLMGADDDLVKVSEQPESIIAIRSSLNLSSEDFVVITGGKIDAAKRQTLLLMEAFQKLKQENLKLLIFGSVADDMKEEFLRLCASDHRIIYIGWISSDATYRYIAASDLAVYPGRHSVLWEQTAGQGVPMVCKFWEGTGHVDAGGNVAFLYEDSVQEMKRCLGGILSREGNYAEMKRVARDKAMSLFSYERISRQSIEWK